MNVRLNAHQFGSSVPSAFRNTMLARKMWSEDPVKSALHTLWTGDEDAYRTWDDHDDFLVITADLIVDPYLANNFPKISTIPLGVLVVERRYCSLLTSLSTAKDSAPRTLFLRVLGAMNIYVIPEARGRGVGKAMARAAEFLCLKNLGKEQVEWTPDDIPVVVAHGDAIPLIKSSCSRISPVPTYHASPNRDAAIKEAASKSAARKDLEHTY